MNSRSRQLFSLIVPTRCRPAKLRLFLDSVKATTAQLDTIELILITDADDQETLSFEYRDFPIKRIVVEPGLTMGALNMAGYEAATGDYIMLLNDDVIIRTENWDKKVLAAFNSFADGIVLVHVNDRIFEEKLCTFPFLSRKYCEIAGGICPVHYLRYRIDDHIYNVFNLLAVLGRLRILYLADVIFEHTNYVLNAFRSPEYRPDESIHRIDTQRFDEFLPERKQLALQLMDHIDRYADSEKSRLRENLLKPITDSVALRRHEYIRVRLEGKPLSSDDTRVTIGVVSADFLSDPARTCIDLIKKFTKNFDLVLLDNNRSPNFNHAREMNKLLSMRGTDLLVMMDDDVFVEPGWLDGMLRCMSPSVGVVTPLHKDLSGNLSYAGVVMRPDYSGHHTHSLAVPKSPTPIQTLCSAIMLIDLSKCGQIRFDESYMKYFLDIDYGFRVWSAGFEVVCSPYTMVTHIGGGTLQHGSSRSYDLFERDRQYYSSEWIETRKYHDLEQGIWQKVPEIKTLLDVPQCLAELLRARSKASPLAFRERSFAFFKFLQDYPALKDWAHRRIWNAAGSRRPHGDDPELGYLEVLMGCMQHPTFVEENYYGLNIVLYEGNYYATPSNKGTFDYDRFIRGYYTRSYQSENLDILKARIRGRIQTIFSGNVRSKNKTSLVHPGAGGLIETWRRLRQERTRFGSWKPALRSVGKPILKRQIISIFGVQTFFRFSEIYLQSKALKHKPCGRSLALWSVTKLAFNQGLRHLWPKLMPSQSRFGNFFIDAEAKIRRKATETADPQRWLSGSPLTQIEKDYRGYSIYRLEFKFFAVGQTTGTFCYEDFKRGKYDQCLIGHSLGEVHALVDQVLSTTELSGECRVLVFACLPLEKLKPLLNRLYPRDSFTLLVGKADKQSWEGYKTISLEQDSVDEWAHGQKSLASDPLLERLMSESFQRTSIPWSFPETWTDNSLEIAASKISNCVEILHSSGERRLYQGENLHRLTYNKAYLASMFQDIPYPQGRTVLEAGCSDGLVCDILAYCGAAKIVGIDVMKTVGCGFRHDVVDYRVMEIGKMDFSDQSFDIVYSIATFEHVAKPYNALSEMLRVTKIGGYVYIQAGPLYYSPFGHHMFAYFQDYPWIHLRKSTDEIIAIAKERRIDHSIERDLAMTCEEYVKGMLNADHVNGLLLEDYRLSEFRKREDVEFLKFNVSYEGAELLTPEIRTEIGKVNTDRLIEHGFEIAFRRIA
jgi:GT2 family glycosyltransferase/SAM-dependent methyltransferase